MSSSDHTSVDGARLQKYSCASPTAAIVDSSTIRPARPYVILIVAPGCTPSFSRSGAGISTRPALSTLPLYRAPVLRAIFPFSRLLTYHRNLPPAGRCCSNLGTCGNTSEGGVDRRKRLSHLVRKDRRGCGAGAFACQLLSSQTGLLVGALRFLELGFQVLGGFGLRALSVVLGADGQVVLVDGALACTADVVDLAHVDVGPDFGPLGL